ncbi:hypothetical protein ADK38_38980, partial [Streptomyces varsoviensis]
QPKAKRQAGAAVQGGTKATGSTSTPQAGERSRAGKPPAKDDAKPSLDKKQPEDAKPKSAGGSSSRNAKSGQRKGPQRPKHPSKK